MKYLMAITAALRPYISLQQILQKQFTTQALTTDENYLSVYHIPLRAGSFFEGHALDSGKIVLNEAAVYALGWKNISDAVGQQVRIPAIQQCLPLRA
jgi:hypothetical protein